MDLWHGVPVGDSAPQEVNAIVEIPRGSHNKYEIDKKTGLIKLDRANYSSAAYPFDYGFVPQTLWDDDDALDVIILSSNPLFPGILVVVRPVALLRMTDSGDADEKVVGVPVEDKRFDDIKDLADLNKHNLKEYTHFFETYKNLKGKPAAVDILGWEGADAARSAVTRSLELYAKKFGAHG